ncbi:MAG: hypothetical protein QOF13_1268, partial [Solirubrobacterales bacterium]|nr:hypothetical protein [Solirubrobacterales bacterium]
MGRGQAEWGETRSERGAASVEHVGLVALVAMLLVAVVAAV